MISVVIVFLVRLIRRMVRGAITWLIDFFGPFEPMTAHDGRYCSVCDIGHPADTRGFPICPVPWDTWCMDCQAWRQRRPRGGNCGVCRADSLHPTFRKVPDWMRSRRKSAS
jgi:hypothetical protein